MVKRVYVVDDAETLAQVEAALPEAEVVGFDSGKAAYDQSRQDPPDVLVVGILLADLLGLACCRLLKFHERHGGIPILALAGTADPLQRDQALGAGADAFLTKPLEPEALRTCLKGLLARNVASAAG